MGMDIRVNSIVPGFICAPMIREAIRRLPAEAGVDERALRQGLTDLHPFGRFLDRRRRRLRPYFTSRPTNQLSSQTPTSRSIAGRRLAE